MATQSSMKELLKRGFSDFHKLTTRALITEKLAAINILIYRFLVSIIISAFLWQSLTVSFIIIYIIAFALSSLTLFLYIPLVEYLAEHAKHLIEGLRASIILMFFDLTIAIGGLLFRNILLTTLALIIIVIQLLVILLTNITLLTKPKFDRNAEPLDVWKYVGKITLGCGIASLLLDLAVLIYRYAIYQPLRL